MSRIQLQRAGVRALVAAFILTVVFACGTTTGAFFAAHDHHEADEHDSHDHDETLAASNTNPHDHEHDDDHEHEHEEEEDHVALTKQAVENLQLKMGHLSKGDYWKTLLVPGRVIEIPGQSNLSISASITGIIEQVNVLPGQTLVHGEPLFTIRISDEALIDTQSKLLDLLTRREVAKQEIERLKPLIESGAVSGSKTRELQYEVKQMRAQEETLKQELKSRGMPVQAIDSLIADRELTTLTSVFTPNYTFPLGQDAKAKKENSYGYSVEDLVVHPGMSVERGDALCTVAFHPRLYLVGTAFQDDLPILRRIIEENWKVAVATEESEEHTHSSHLHLDLLRVDNHVDEETQTVKFYLELPNEVTHTRLRDGRKFEQWRFRPGQRLHMRLPQELWKDQVTLPAEAVVIDGPNVFVFAEHDHEEDEDHAQDHQVSVSDDLLTSEEGPEHDEDEHDHDIFIELEPVPVRMLYRDDKTVVIANDGQLHANDEIALNNAYKLYLAMKMQSGGGGGHHHHDH